jgi:UDP-N-acetylmuramate dehydrogenase
VNAGTLLPTRQGLVNTNYLYDPNFAGLEWMGDRLRMHVPLSRYTAARVGGPAEGLVETNSASELEALAKELWERSIPFLVLGGGSNVLVSDSGVRGVVVINRARAVQIDDQTQPPSVWTESGANLGVVARQVALHGLSGLEWAAGIPGTVGGAVVGNAGAHGGEMADNLLVADILHRSRGMEQWNAGRFDYKYRSSVLKQLNPTGRSPETIVLGARMKLERSTPEQVQSKLDEFVAHRRRTQPPGASMGSMFKNPPGDYAGRLIEAAGLKGMRSGDAQISSLHANFFINLGRAAAADIYQLIQIARQAVLAQFGVELELEIELIGEWN